MSNNNEYIEQLVVKFHKGSISPEELDELTGWYNGHDDSFVVISDQASESIDELKSRMLAGLLKKVEAGKIHPVKLHRKKLWGVAAAAAVILIMGAWFTLRDTPSISVDHFVTSSIEPGGNKATLTLSNGHTVVLSNTQSGIIAGSEITYANGVPVEEAQETYLSDEEASLVLQTPRGGTYKLTLPDGSEVWLNAESTLKYPARFSAGERVVQLSGEAYFHVQPVATATGERIPFRVISSGQEIEVLGTQFNVNAYPGQRAIKTTLVNGKVAVKGTRGKVMLQPNEQAIITGNSSRSIPVNVYNYTAWHEGKFSFDGKSFEETMNDIGRWYDLKVVYEGGTPEEELIGDAYRNQKISLVLRILDVAEINYRLDATRRILTIKGKINKI